MANSELMVPCPAFAHEEMKGFNVLLKALPTDGRLELRRFTETKETSGKSKATAKAS